MKIVYRDEIGYVSVEVDKNGIDFVDGKAYFNVGGKNKNIIIPVENIMSINP